MHATPSDKNNDMHMRYVVDDASEYVRIYVGAALPPLRKSDRRC